MRPRLSIITPLLNRAAMLQVALDSVGAQGDAVFEHLVVDGGSTDGSREMVQATKAELVDAPSSSIYEALNIGIARARGDIICLLNSDDRLPRNAMAIAIAAFEQDKELELLRGRAGVEIQIGDTWKRRDEAPPAATVRPLRRVLFGASNINACILARTLVDRIGPFEASYRVSADREWLTRAVLAGAKISEVEDVLYIYRSHAGSLTIGADKPARRAWVREHLAFAAKMLADPKLSAAARADLRAFLGKETVHLALLSVRAGELAEAGRAMAATSRVDASWPLQALGPLADIARRRVGGA